VHAVRAPLLDESVLKLATSISALNTSTLCTGDRDCKAFLPSLRRCSLVAGEFENSPNTLLQRLTAFKEAAQSIYLSNPLLVLSSLAVPDRPSYRSKVWKTLEPTSLLEFRHYYVARVVLANLVGMDSCCDIPAMSEIATPVWTKCVCTAGIHLHGLLDLHRPRSRYCDWRAGTAGRLTKHLPPAPNNPPGP
jgi:hypothetical protein